MCGWIVAFGNPVLESESLTPRLSGLVKEAKDSGGLPGCWPHTSIASRLSLTFFSISPSPRCQGDCAESSDSGRRQRQRRVWQRPKRRRALNQRVSTPQCGFHIESCWCKRIRIIYGDSGFYKKEAQRALWRRSLGTNAKDCFATVFFFSRKSALLKS